MFALLRWLSLALALALGALFPAIAQAGEVTLANGDVLTGRTWRDQGVLHIDHPALGLVKLQPQHYRRAVLDLDTPEPGLFVPTPTAPRISPTDVTSPAAAAACCEPPALVDPKIAPGCLPECVPAFQFAIGAGMALDGGNTDKQQFNLDADAQYKWRKVNTLDFRTTNFYERANGIQTEGKYFGTLRYQRDITDRTYLFGVWLAQRDDFSDILLRTTWTAGAGHYAIKRENEFLKGEAGLGVAYENRKDQPELETASGYLGARYKRTFGDGDYFDARAWTVQYFERHGLSPYQLQLRYGHPVRAHLDVTASFLLDYVDAPPTGIRSTDTKFVVGLRWRPTEKSR